jgi:Transposase DDE domain group 1
LLLIEGSCAGSLLLRQVDRRLGLMRRFAACLTDRRDPRFVEHQVETLVGQRTFGLALGHEDLVDHDELRKDPTLAVLAGKLEPSLRSDCEASAGKRTLHRLEHHAEAAWHDVSQDQLRRARMHCWSIVFVEAREHARRARSWIDLDNTDIRLLRRAGSCLFHGDDLHRPPDISALIRRTVPVPTPSVVAISRTPMSPFFSALQPLA